MEPHLSGIAAIIAATATMITATAKLITAVAEFKKRDDK